MMGEGLPTEPAPPRSETFGDQTMLKQGDPHNEVVIAGWEVSVCLKL
jgi:hypothetical protein